MVFFSSWPSISVCSRLPVARSLSRTVGDQVGDAIDDTIKATGQAAKSINKETVDLRDAVKQAVDDHLSTGNGN